MMWLKLHKAKLKKRQSNQNRYERKTTITLMECQLSTSIKQGNGETVSKSRSPTYKKKDVQT